MRRFRIPFATLLFAAAASSWAVTATLPRSGFLGVQADVVNAETRARLQLPDEKGALVSALVEGGTAKAAGLQPGDVIVGVDGDVIAKPADLVAAIGRRRAGDRIAIRWIRRGNLERSEVAVAPRPLEAGPGTRTEYSAVRVGDALRRVIVTAPPSGDRHPGVLYVTGIGCFSQESLGAQSVEAKLLHGLARAGFVTMRVEKSGIGDSEGPPCASPQVDLQAEIAGYVEGLKALKERADVMPDRVFVVGLSIGGVEAPLIAQREPVKGLVVVNTVAKGFVEYLVETRRRQATLAGTPFDQVEREQRIGEMCDHAFLVQRQRGEDLLREHPECADFTKFPASSNYMQQWAGIDIASEWKRVGGPVLIVQGEQDFVATVGDAPLLREIVESFHPGRAQLVMVPAMDHYLSRAESMKASMDRGGVAGEFHEGVLEAIRAWLTEQAQRG